MSSGLTFHSVNIFFSLTELNFYVVQFVNLFSLMLLSSVLKYLFIPQVQKDVPMLFLRSIDALLFTVRSTIHLELMFGYDVR